MEINSGDTAWLLVSTALVLLMTVPGLALFYGGLVGRANVLTTCMQSFVVFCLVSIQWLLVGYTLSFNRTCEASLVGSIWRASPGSARQWRPRQRSLTCCLRCTRATFAIITVALISGAIVERHAVRRVRGFSALCGRRSSTTRSRTGCGAAAGWTLGALDFAGGTVVHISAGVSALVAAIVVGKRGGFAGVAGTAQRAVHRARRGPALVWLVRLQRRQRAGGQRPRGDGVRVDEHGGGCGGAHVDRARSVAPRQSRPRSVRRRARSWDSSRSRPPPGS